MAHKSVYLIPKLGIIADKIQFGKNGLLETAQIVSSRYGVLNVIAKFCLGQSEKAVKSWYLIKEEAGKHQEADSISG